MNAIVKGLPLWTESWETVKRITGVLELNQKTMNGRRECIVDGETLESEPQYQGEMEACSRIAMAMTD